MGWIITLDHDRYTEFASALVEEFPSSGVSFRYKNGERLLTIPINIFGSHQICRETVQDKILNIIGDLKTGGIVHCVGVITHVDLIDDPRKLVELDEATESRKSEVKSAVNRVKKKAVNKPKRTQMSLKNTDGEV